MCGGRGRGEMERENPQADFMLRAEPHAGSIPRPEIMIGAETKSRIINN